MTRNTRILLSCVYWAFVLYVFVPLILMVVMGFKDSKFIGFPIKTWTLDWYLGVFEDAEDDGGICGDDVQQHRRLEIRPIDPRRIRPWRST